VIVGIAAAICLGPLIAWRLHERRVDGSATSGAVLGCIAGVVVVLWVVLPAAWILAYGVSALSTVVGLSVTKDAATIAIGVATAVTCLAVGAWLDVDALRDLSPQRRGHVWLDVARLVATVAYLAYAMGVIILVAAGSGPDAGMHVVLLVSAPGTVGAAVVTVADVMVRRDEQRGHGRLISGV
jgi:hypothetical protein